MALSVTEFQIGDWVLHFNKPCKVFGIKDIHKGHDAILLFGQNGFRRKGIEPIPITPEILEKNGFRAETFLSSEWGCEVYFREFPGCVVEPDDAGYTFGTISYWGKQANDGSPEDWGTMYESRIKALHSVHELQHALRLCGLDELADNFIV